MRMKKTCTTKEMKSQYKHSSPIERKKMVNAIELCKNNLSTQSKIKKMIKK